VLHDVATRTNTNLRLAAQTPLAAALSDSGHGLLLVSELAQGEDLNGDGDLDDSVLFRFERSGAGPAGAAIGGR
jgi:hypothetical protein